MDHCPMSFQSFGVIIIHPPSLALVFHCKPMTHHPSISPPFYNVSTVVTASYISWFPYLLKLLSFGNDMSPKLPFSGLHRTHNYQLLRSFSIVPNCYRRYTSMLSSHNLFEYWSWPQALSVAWIRAFPQIKCVSLRGYSTTTAEDLVNIVHRFAASDVELAVVLQNFPGWWTAPSKNSIRCLCKLFGVNL